MPAADAAYLETMVRPRQPARTIKSPATRPPLYLLPATGTAQQIISIAVVEVGKGTVGLKVNLPDKGRITGVMPASEPQCQDRLAGWAGPLESAAIEGVLHTLRGQRVGPPAFPGTRESSRKASPEDRFPRRSVVHGSSLWLLVARVGVRFGRWAQSRLVRFLDRLVHSRV